jgi:hypothetical protein
VSRPAAVAVGAGSLVVGLLVAAAATLVSRMCWRPGSVTVPFGMVLAVAACAAVVLLARSVSRANGFAAAAGWLIGLGYVVNGTSGGGFLVAGDALGWSFLVLGTVASLGTALWGQLTPPKRH